MTWVQIRIEDVLRASFQCADLGYREWEVVKSFIHTLSRDERHIKVVIIRPEPKD